MNTAKQTLCLITIRSGLVCFIGFAALLILAGCANFRLLGKNLKFMENSYILAVKLDGTTALDQIRGMVVEWDADLQKVISADFAQANSVGGFGFFVQSADNQYVLAYRDTNGNSRYDAGEPAWIYSNSAGQPIPVTFDSETRRVFLQGSLKTTTVFPEAMLTGGLAFIGDQPLESVISGLSVSVALGDLADLDDPRFSAERGVEGLWQPSGFPIDSGIGVYFLEKYDPHRVPVLFVYGAAGSPQDWRTFFSELDTSRYQIWFYYYPTGRRLGEMGSALNRCVESLHSLHGFKRLHVVAHSMGGLVARAFIVNNVLDDNQRYIDRFVTISTPWGGHEAASMGVKRAPEVVPSWRDMVAGSDFQEQLYARDISGKVDHLLIFGTKSKKSMVLPPRNDGTVSVASETFSPIKEMSVHFKGFYSDHVGILSNPEVIQLTEDFLAQ